MSKTWVCGCGVQQSLQKASCIVCRAVQSNDPMPEVLINGRWRLRLPQHRADERGPKWETHEYARLDAMHKAIRPGDIIFDIGAEEGDMSALLALWTGPFGEVHLFEPDARVWPNIKAIWDANNLKPPVGCFSGFAGHMSTLNWSNPDVREWPPGADGPLISDHGFCQLRERPDLNSVTLDDYGTMFDIAPHVLTMDVEGSELQVLRGAEKMLRVCKPVVFVSVHPESMCLQWSQYENELYWFMEHELGYDRIYLDHQHERHVCWQHHDNRRLRITPQVVERTEA